jgi:hypothetical protein
MLRVEPTTSPTRRMKVDNEFVPPGLLMTSSSWSLRRPGRLRPTRSWPRMVSPRYPASADASHPPLCASHLRPLLPSFRILVLVPHMDPLKGFEVLVRWKQDLFYLVSDVKVILKKEYKALEVIIAWCQAGEAEDEVQEVAGLIVAQDTQVSQFGHTITPWVKLQQLALQRLPSMMHLSESAYAVIAVAFLDCSLNSSLVNLSSCLFSCDRSSINALFVHLLL